MARKTVASSEKTRAEVVNVRLDPKLAAAIDDYVRTQNDPELTRSAAIRALLRKGLAL